MDPFVRRLVERLLDPTAPLSRNRHFQTFESPEGRRALRVSRRLEALAQSILECRRLGGASSVKTSPGERGELRVELRLKQLAARRVTLLDEDEFKLLCRLPGVSAALAAS